MKVNPLALAVDLLPALSGKEKEKVFASLSSVEEFARLTQGEIERMIGRIIPRARLSPAEALKAAEKEVRLCEAKGISVCRRGERLYPPLLGETFDPPFLLYYIGNLEPKEPRFFVSVVGTRHPTLEGSRAAYLLGCDAVQEGGVVVSGLARGIDGAAHKGAVDAGGPTWAVLGSGLCELYPRHHRRLAIRIVEAGGALISEYAPSVPARKHHFPERNRIIAGCTRGTVVVEAPARSGALITAQYALDEGRDVFVHGDLLSSPQGEGVRALADSGAKAVGGIADILEDWGIPSQREAPADGGGGSRTGDRGRPGETVARLMEAELEGHILRHGGSIIKRKP